MTEPEKSEHSIYLVAHSYDAQCTCGHTWEDISLPFGSMVIECPDCGTAEEIDGNSFVGFWE
jgi:hypothetical protein